MANEDSPIRQAAKKASRALSELHQIVGLQHEDGKVSTEQTEAWAWGGNPEAFASWNDCAKQWQLLAASLGPVVPAIYDPPVGDGIVAIWLRCVLREACALQQEIDHHIPEADIPFGSRRFEQLVVHLLRIWKAMEDFEPTTKYEPRPKDGVKLPGWQSPFRELRTLATDVQNWCEQRKHDHRHENCPEPHREWDQLLRPIGLTILAAIHQCLIKVEDCLMNPITMGFTDNLYSGNTLGAYVAESCIKNWLPSAPSHSGGRDSESQLIQHGESKQLVPLAQYGDRVRILAKCLAATHHYSLDDLTDDDISMFRQVFLVRLFALQETPNEADNGNAMALEPSGNVGQSTDEPAGSNGKPKDVGQKTKHKRSTTRGDARAKIVAGLSAHHEYDNGSCLNTNPIQVNSFAKKIGVGSATVSDFLKEQFGEPGYNQCKIACRNSRNLGQQLMTLNGEKTPSILYNSISDDHAEETD